MSRFTTTGRDTWSHPGNLSSARSEQAYRFEPTTASRFAELCRAEREPLWVSIFAGMAFAAGVAVLVFAWSLA